MGIVKLVPDRLAGLDRVGEPGQRTTPACPTAFIDTISFRRASCRARCASVHIVPLSQTTMVTAGSDRDQPHRPTQTGSQIERDRAALAQVVNPVWVKNC